MAWRRPIRVPLLALIGFTSFAGCALFSLGPAPTTVVDGPGQAQVDGDAFVELDRLRAQALAADAGSDALLAYAHAHLFALHDGLFDRVGQGQARHAELAGWLDDAIAADPGDQLMALDHARATLDALTGEPALAAARWLAALERGERGVIFAELSSLPRSPEVDAAVVEGCAVVRPDLSEADVPRFVELCLARAGGDRARLSWPGAAADIQAYEQDLIRREQARIAAQNEAERLAREQTWLLATLFASGSCQFGDCSTEGWNSDTATGQLRSRCRFGDCLQEGWDTDLPDGGRAESRCRFGDCAEHGWDTRLPDGSTAQTRCRFSNCFEDGWDTRLGDTTAESRCRFSNCFEDGWDTRPREGSSLACRCRFGACLSDGAECR